MKQLRTIPSLFTLSATVMLAACSVAPDDAATEQNAGALGAMPACGTPLQTWDGTSAFSNGWATNSDQSCDGVTNPIDGGEHYQCVELVMRHFRTHYDGLFWFGDAHKLLANAPAGRTSVYYRGDASHPPVPGDMIVSTNGSPGHVALVVGTTPSSIDIIEQNVSGNGFRSIPWNGGFVGGNFSGWAHANVNDYQSMPLRARTAVWNKYYGCDPNGSEKCGSLTSTNAGWGAVMQSRLGRPTDWNPNDPGRGLRGEPLVVPNTVQDIWFSTFQRGQIYAYLRGSEWRVFEVIDFDDPSGQQNFFSWYAFQLTPNGTNSFVGIPNSGLEKCGSEACMSFVNEATSCHYTARLRGSSIHVDADRGGCVIPAQFQDLPNIRHF
ncbi:MAG: CHAP domain-containing protein [Polyangiaceae bacterium]|nr:CHAP domain-containing protein [Polyangiaceae bacterium]